MPTPSVSLTPPPLLPAPDITPAAEQRLAAIRYVVLDESVPKELHSLIHSFISQHKLSPSPHLCGYSFVIVSHTATEEQLLVLHRRIVSLAAVTLLPSSLFLSIPSQPSSPPASAPPTRPAILSFLSLFSRWRVSCSALLAEEKALLAHLTTSLSGYYGRDLDATYTHLITKSSRSDKYAACQRTGCITVLPAYLLRCYRTATLPTPTAADSQRLLTGMRLCVTGIEAQERNTIMRVIQAEGGEYSANLTKTCSHLIAQKAEGPKYEAAKLWELRIVSKAWLLTCIKDRRVAEEKEWPVDRMMEQEKETGEEESKEAAGMEVDGSESKHESVDGVGRMNGHRMQLEQRDEEEETEQERVRHHEQQQQRQDEEKRREVDEQKEERKRNVNAAPHHNGADTSGWKKKAKKATKDQKAEEDDSLKTVPLPPEPASAPVPLATTVPTVLSADTSHSVSAFASVVSGGGNDSYLDTVQVLLCLPLSSPLFLRCVALIRVAGGTRLSSYRPTVTHIVGLNVAHVQTTLRSDRFSLLPPAALASATPADFATSLPTTIVSPDWLESCHTLKRLVPASPFQLTADEETAPPPAPSRPSSIARQKVVSEFSAFNDNIAREKRDVAAVVTVAHKKRRRTRSTAKGVFAGKLFAFEGLELREQEELLLSIRNEGGDVLAADETEDDARIVVAKHWTTDLPRKYSHATFVTSAYINDCLSSHSLLQPNLTLDYQPLPEHSSPLPSFSSYLFALTGFSRHEQEQLKRLLQFLGAKGVTDSMHADRNTHLVCKEGCAAGRKWELAWKDSWKGRVVRLQWLVECVRHGKEVPLTDELVWKKADENAEWRDTREKAVVSVVEQKDTDMPHQGSAGKRAVITGLHGDASASPAIAVEMEDEAQQPPLQSIQQRGREADDEDIERTEQDSTAEHMEDIQPPTTTSPPQIDAPKATHDTAEEQSDILAPLPPPSPNSINSSPFPTRYGRQHGQRTNRIYTPPKTPTSTSTSSSVEDRTSDETRGRRRRLAVEDKGVVQQPMEDDPFGFQGADEVKEKKKQEVRGEAKAVLAGSVKEKREVQRKRIEEDGEEGSDKVVQHKSMNGGTQQADEASDAVGENDDTSKARTLAANGKLGTRKQVEDELQQMDEAETGKQHKGGARVSNDSREAEKDGANAATEAARSRMPGRKRLNTEQRKEKGEEEEEAEYVPAASKAAEQDEVEEVKEATSRPHSSNKKRTSKEAVKVRRQTAAAKQDQPVEEAKARATSSRGKTRAKQSVSPPSESTDRDEEEKETEEEEKSSTNSTDSSVSAVKKSARRQRKEQLKAQDSASPIKSRTSRRTAAQHDSESKPAPDNNQPIRTTRKRSAHHTDDSTSIDSGESISSTSKRTRVSSAAAVDESNKYRFAIASKSMSVDKAQSLREMIEQMGAECIADADDYSLCSAVVIKDNAQLKRTEKVLAAIVAGLPILPRSYIEDSSKHGSFLSLYSYRLKQKDALDETGAVLMRAAARWEKKRPFKGWTVWIADSRQGRMLTNVVGMGGGHIESRDVSRCTQCVVSVEEAGVEAVLKRMWDAGVPVYRSEMVVEFICYSDRRDEWNMDDFKLAKDNWKSVWTNPWKGEVSSSQSTHGPENVEADGRKKRRS